MPTPSYTALRAAAEDLANLEAALGLLSWDQEVFMAKGSAKRRAGHLASMAGLHHQVLLEKVKPALESALDDLDKLSPEEQLNLRQLKRSVDKQTKLPDAFVRSMAATTSKAQSLWEEAKAAGNFKLFAPILEEVVALKRQEADYYGYHASPYDALIDSYEPEGKAADIARLFEELKPQLKALLDEMLAAPQVDDAFLRTPVAAEQQWQYSLQLLKHMGFDFNRGRQDRSTHPFTSGLGPEDVRLTTRIDEGNIGMMLYSCIHEFGHGVYEQGLSGMHYGLPQGQACSLSIHESQSRFWENNMARTQAFWQWAHPAFAALYNGRLSRHSHEDLFRAFNRIEPSFIRIEADELTYHFHIILRFEIEQALMEGQLQVADIPEAWNSKVKTYLGIDVPDDAHGALQDIHWSHGSFGYFPTYSLGSLYAAHFEHHMRQDLPTLDQHMAAGNFAPIHQWNREKLYQHGALYNSEELCVKATGQPLQPAYFLSYLRTKLSRVYSLA